MTVASDLVNVTVSVADAGVTREGFATPLVFAPNPHTADVVLTFTASSYVADLTTYGFSATDEARIGLDAVFSQRPRPKIAKLGKKTVADTQVVVLTPTVGVAGFIHAVSIQEPNGTIYPATYTNDSTPTLAEACTGIAAAINATATTMTADGTSGTTVVLTSDAAGVLHSVFGLTSNITLTDTTTQSSISSDLDAIDAADDDWYGLVLVNGAPTHIAAASAWIETKQKICIAQTHDMAILGSSTTDPASVIKTAGYNNTRVLYNGRALSVAGGALMGQLLTYDPGQADLDTKTLVGVYADALTETQSGHIVSKDAISYETVLGRAMTIYAGDGTSRFLDIQMIVHWVSARLQEAYISAKLASPKIAYTDSGIGAVMYGICRNVVKQGQDSNAIDEDPTTWSIDVPLVSDQQPSDRAARKFPGTQLAFRASGAVHSADINVAISE